MSAWYKNEDESNRRAPREYSGVGDDLDPMYDDEPVYVLCKTCPNEFIPPSKCESWAGGPDPELHCEECCETQIAYEREERRRWRMLFPVA